MSDTAKAQFTDIRLRNLLQYIEQFGGYDSPTVAQLIAGWENGKTGDEGLGVPGDGGDAGNDAGSEGPSSSDPGDGLGTADVTAETADEVIDWAWGQDKVVTDFDPSSSTIFVGWISSDQLDVSEINGSTVFEIPSNNQSLTLIGVSLAELSSGNFTFLDSTAANEVLDLIGQGSSDNGNDSRDDSDTDSSNNDDTSGDTSDDASDDADPQIVALSWNWAAKSTIGDFDTDDDKIDFGNISSGQLGFSTADDGDVVIEILNNGGQTYRFENVSADDLGADNFMAANWNLPTVDFALDELANLA